MSYFFQWVFRLRSRQEASCLRVAIAVAVLVVRSPYSLLPAAVAVAIAIAVAVCYSLLPAAVAVAVAVCPQSCFFSCTAHFLLFFHCLPALHITYCLLFMGGPPVALQCRVSELQ